MNIKNEHCPECRKVTNGDCGAHNFAEGKALPIYDQSQAQAAGYVATLEAENAELLKQVKLVDELEDDSVEQCKIIERSIGEHDKLTTEINGLKAVLGRVKGRLGGEFAGVISDLISMTSDISEPLAAVDRYICGCGNLASLDVYECQDCGAIRDEYKLRTIVILPKAGE